MVLVNQALLSTTLLFIAAIQTSSGDQAITETVHWSKESVSEALTEARAGIVQHQREQESSSEAKALQAGALQEKLHELSYGVASVSRDRSLLTSRQQQVDRLVRQANAEQLRRLLGRLVTSLEQEINLRDSSSSSTASIAETAASIEDSLAVEDSFIEAREVKKTLDREYLLGDSEKQLTDWVKELIQDELSKYENELINTTTTLSKEEKSVSSDSTNCPSIAELAQEVQSALSQYASDGVGSVDHLQGGEIVHSMTSPTYVLPPTAHDLMGNVWWRRYIPQDWESWLPAGWEEWDTALLPSSLYHSLNVKGGRSASPETILSTKVVPGSCWPMDGSTGRITIRLPYPIKVDTFTLDHIPSRILEDGNEKSAPKQIVVTAYPPCNESDARCTAVGFDVKDPMQIGQFTYDLEGKSSVQTFDSIFVPLDAGEGEKKTSTGELQNELLGEEANDEESCSTEGAACSTPPKIDVAGITVRIQSNHGNSDYTCLYRFRLHGEPVLN